jgi:hypothetical protein
MDTDTVSLQISHVFGLWVELKEQAGFKRKPILTDKRKNTISEMLSKHNYDDIISVIKFLTSEDKYAVYMRDNKYIELDNIFRKWEQKVSKAKHYEKNKPKKVVKSEFFIPFSIVDQGDM